MDLQKFDSTIKSALENLEVPYEPGSWDLLSKRLDALPAPDAVDKAVRPALERVETPYDAGSWTTLAARMDGLARARRVRLIKLSEAAIFLLLLLNLNGFFGVVKSVTNPAPEPAKGLHPQQPVAARNRSPLTPKTIGNQTVANKSLVDEVASATAEMIENLRELILPETTPAPETPATLATPQNTASLLDPGRFYGQSGPVKFHNETGLPPKPAQKILYASASASPGLPSFILPAAPAKSNWYAAMFASYDQNRMTDGDAADRQQTWSSGMAVGYRKGKWGVETGLAYAPKSYQPQRVNVEYFNDPFQGLAFYHINQVDADVFSVPVKVTRRIAKVGNTSAHAVAGVSGHFATSKGYAYKTVLYPPPVIGGGQDPLPNPPSVADFPSGKGLLENGDLSQNAYASADLGLRVEQNIGRRYTAFVEPVYRRSITGDLGPHTARIHTFAVQAGVMTRL